MILEYAINRHKTKILDHALSEQKTVERIACLGFWFCDSEDMSLIDDEQHDADCERPDRDPSFIVRTCTPRL